ncbi:hypothetical protein [Flavobacterium sp.]|uniref:hypothetical protein n=1 Tax=Flavobacterium sp. TaxID=239 RepID=UPI00286DE9B1|nr:hypothetical protein [Flavobacterium sp.]
MAKLIIFLSIHILLLFLLVYINRKYYCTSFSNVKIAMCCSVIFYISMVILAFATSYYLKQELNSFDLDKNGLFTEEEWTIEQSRLIRDVSNDTGRNLAPFTGIVFSILYFIIIIIPLSIFNKKTKQITE